MGGLKKYMPITYWTSLIGSLALIGFPGFSGFFSKDAIIEAVRHSEITGAGFAYFAVLAGVFVTAFYSFRMFFLVFHGKERMDEHTRSHLHECPPVVTVPLIALAIPSVIIGAMTIGPMLFGSYFDGVIYVADSHNVLAQVGEHFHGALSFVLHGLMTPAFYLAMAGLITAGYIYLVNPNIAAAAKERMSIIYKVLEHKYGFDEFNSVVFGCGSRALGQKLWKIGDVTLIDGLLVNGSARVVAWFSSVVRHVQTGLLYHYAFAMIIGLILLLGWWVVL